MITGEASQSPQRSCAYPEGPGFGCRVCASEMLRRQCGRDVDETWRRDRPAGVRGAWRDDGDQTGTAKPAGQYDATDFRNTNPRWQPGNFEKNVEAVDRLGRLATAKGITVSQLALAWLLAQGEHIVPIPGTRSAARLEENTHAADVALTEGDLAAIREILPTGGFGARYAEEHVPNWV
jgi:hypothetical protein